MKLFNVEYNPLENEGIYALSVVKNPAMQSNWITLSENKTLKLATVDKERRILMGVALIPNKPIYRKDTNGEYNIVFSSNTVEQAAHDFVKRGNTNNSTLEHEIDLGSDAVSVVESWIIADDVNDKTRKYGLNEPVGSWAVMMKVHDDATWEKAKNGEILGFSIDGMFNLNEITKKVNMSETKKSSNWTKLAAYIASLASEDEQETDVKLMSVMTADGNLEIMYDVTALEVGSTVFIENEGERVPLPVGDYPLEDGTTLVVAEEGIAAEIVETVAADPIPDGEAELADAEMDKFVEMLDKALGLKELKENSEIIKTELAAIKLENESLKSQLVEFGKTPATTKVTIKKAEQKIDLSLLKTKQERLFAQLQNRN
jgi:hypothetical protein